MAPDSNTALYTAVERYDPWEDTWRFVTEPQAAVLQLTIQNTAALKPLWLNAIHRPGLCLRCRSRTFDSPCPCPTTFPSLPASATVSMCWAAFRGLGRSCCCSTTPEKVRLAWERGFKIKYNKKKIRLCLSLPEDSWLELLPTLTRADADLPALYFLGATDRLLVIGGNNTETLITSFCPHTRKWGQVRTRSSSCTNVCF